MSAAARSVWPGVTGLLDSLTGLASRTGFEVAVAAAVDRARQDGSALALVFIDLNEFNRINDSLGHSVGEELLTQVAERLQGALHPGDIAARLGDDEFAVLSAGLPALSNQQAEAIGQRIADGLDGPYRLGVAELLVDTSIGVSAFPNDADRQDTLVKHAEAAMHEARTDGVGIAIYDEDTPDPIERLALAARLRRAVECDELVLHYQPIFRLGDRRILGVEALVRWQDPQRGLVPPDEFIPVAERTGVIDVLGDWVLRLADACGYDVVAEGVEHEEQLAYLATEGCRLAQGFHLGRPGPVAQIEPLLLAGMIPERRRGS